MQELLCIPAYAPIKRLLESLAFRPPMAEAEEWYEEEEDEEDEGEGQIVAVQPVPPHEADKLRKKYRVCATLHLQIL